MKTQEKSNNSNRPNIIAVVLVAILVVTTVFFGVRSIQLNQQARDYQQDQQELNEQYNALNNEFEQLNQDYIALKNENVEMDEELQIRMEELEAEKEKVSNMIRSGGEKLREAEQRIAELQAEKEELEATIEVLIAENEALKTENADLALNLKEQTELNNALTEYNEEITIQLEEVTVERDELLPIANYGQVVRIDELEADAIKTRRNGKERSANSRNAEKIKLCFHLEENPVVESGDQHYYVRIITPEGATLYQEQFGSGTIVSLEDGGSEIMYTSEAVVNIDEDVPNVCWYWGQTNEYQSGQYVAEVYHRGYRVGSETFQL